jgi:hypothetical protein
MARIRFTLISALMLIALGVLTLNSIAQPPGGGGGGGGGRGGFQKGFGGPGGPGGPGGFGGPGGGSLLGLASNPAVQEDLKLKDKQKAAIKSLTEKRKSATDKVRQQQQEFMKEAGINFGGFGPGGFGPGGGGPGQNGQANAQGGQNGGGRGRRGQNADPNAAPGAPNQKGGRGNRPQLTEEQQEQMQMFFASSQEINQNAESSLSRILDKTQNVRIKQIQLQLAGPDALRRPDMIEKLNMTDEQLEQIREFRNEQRQLSREVQKSRGQFFAKLMPPPDNNAQDGGNAQNANQRRGGRGGFNPEAMKQAMEDPENQKQMEQFREQSSKIDEQFSAAVYNKVLYPRQRTIYKKMLGAPFDRSKMGAGGPGWFMPGGRNRGGNPDAAKKDTSPGNATTSAKVDSSGGDAAESASTTKAPTTTAKPKRKSLRDLRGSSGGTPDDQ